MTTIDPTIAALINQRIEQLSAHPFFQRLTPSPDLQQMMAFAPAATFWVMSFQDILRFNHDRTTDPVLKQAIGTHLVEDSGHENWFLSDLAEVFGPASLNARGTFAVEHRDVRDVSFALASEVYLITDDRLRIVYLEVLEAAAGVCFTRVAAALNDAGHGGKLRYFGGQHLNAEASHEMHGEGAGRAPGARALPAPLQAEAARMVGRMCDQFGRLLDAFLKFAPATPMRGEEAVAA